MEQMTTLEREVLKCFSQLGEENMIKALKKLTELTNSKPEPGGQKV